MAFGRRRHFLALGLYLLLTLVMTWPLAANFTTAIPGDGFDGWQNYWNLWWMRSALVEQIQSPLVTELLYAPTGVSLYFHTLNPFNGLVSLPVQIAGGLIPAYNFVVLLSFALSGYGAFLLAAWVQRPRRTLRAPENSQGSSARKGDRERLRSHVQVRFASSLLAGAIFAFTPFHMAQLLGHMQVFAYQWVPFAVLFVLRGLEAQRSGRRWLRTTLAGGLFFALAGLCDWYFVLYLALFTGFAVLWYMVRALFERRRWQHVLGTIAPAAVVGLFGMALLFPLAAPMVAEALRYDFMVRPPDDLYLYSATVADYLIPSRLHTLGRGVSDLWPGNQIAPISERTLAVGYVPLALALVAAVRRRRAWFWLLAAAGFGLLSLGPRMHLGSFGTESLPDTGQLSEWSPYNFVNALVPFMRISRSVSRFTLMVQLSLAIAAALGLYSLLLERPRRVAGLTSLLFVLLLAEFWVAPYPMSLPDTPSWYATLAAESPDPARSALLNLPMNYDRPGYLLYQTVHKRPLTVAYISRDDPRTLTERVPVLQQLRHLGPDIIQADLAAVGPTVLADLGVGFVVLDRYKMPGGLEQEYTEATAKLIFGGQPAEFEDERITVYRTQAVAEPLAYLQLGPENWGPLGEEPFGREIGGEAAAVEIKHGAPGATVEIGYVSAGAVEILDGAGAVAQTLAASPGAVTRVTVTVQGEEFWLRANEGALIVSLALAQ